jgi:putative ABC transport system permease protein
MLAQAMDGLTRQDMESTMTRVMTAQMGMSEEDVAAYITAMDEQALTGLFREMMTQQLLSQYAAQTRAQLASMPPAALAAALDSAMEGYTTAQCAGYYDQVLEFSGSTYQNNLKALGCLDLASPSAIHLYAATFESKEVIEDAIDTYNQGVEELKQIRYTDYAAIMMRSVTSIINAVTYVLISFVAISLVVSSIMIGVITLISVQERTKEIGILRAIGASKRNVSSMFTAETMIIGFTSGMLGVVFTWLLCFPVNALIQTLTGIPNLNAFLPLPAALLLIGISILLTLFAGIIPSRSAAKKDPVEALRTE